MGNKLLIIGCGKMGGAILDSVLGYKDSAFSTIDVIDPNIARDDEANYYKSFSDLNNSKYDVVMLAVKPQMWVEVIDDLNAVISHRTIIISIMAGITIKDLSSAFESNIIIRTMPNLSVTTGFGVTVAISNNGAKPNLVKDLFLSTGRLLWLEDESLMDAVTAVSGSGPAYIFHMVEAMTAAGIKQGLPKDIAYILATETVSGAGTLLQISEDNATTLRQNVTSPNGTTEAGLKVLMNGLEDLMNKTIDAAAKRSKELSNS